MDDLDFQKDLMKPLIQQEEHERSPQTITGSQGTIINRVQKIATNITIASMISNISKQSNIQLKI